MNKRERKQNHKRYITLSTHLGKDCKKWAKTAQDILNSPKVVKALQEIHQQLDMDMMLYGIAVTKDGKRIDPMEFYCDTETKAKNGTLKFRGMTAYIRPR